MFLQGLLHWLAAVALDVVIPKEGEGAAARKMNQFICSSLVAIILIIISFYNGVSNVIVSLLVAPIVVVFCS
jgi:hypothetical protein